MDLPEDPIKEAFTNVRNDINFLNNEISQIKLSIDELKDLLTIVGKTQIKQENQLNLLENTSNLEQNTLNLRQTDIQTDRQINKTYSVTSTDNTTVPQEVEGSKPPNFNISIGNEGASTDRQTIRQTDNQTDIYPKNNKIYQKNQETMDSNIQEASEILNSLDSIKKEIRLKIKHLTPQEMTVFTTIYQLEEQNQDEIDYKILSNKLKLSQSSIRDYIQRMINKGIPIHKNKINNKKITLSISSDLKKIASLPTIIRLREL